MVDFQEELYSCTTPKNIVLGNGFGISYDIAFQDNSFTWETLLELCDIREDSQLYALLEESHFDFELVHQKLNNAINVISMYSPDDQLLLDFAEEVQYLRDQLIIAVSRSHPSSFNVDFTNESGILIKKKILACRSYLNNFSNVFSLNYDLLLYWVRCIDNQYLGRDSFQKEDDKLVFVPDEQASYFFPHGALFLFRDGFGANKSKSTAKNPILARVKDNIRNGIFPMCISEGTGEQKMRAISTNSYLSFSYERMKRCEGTFFTFGCSFMDDKDSHIIKAMIQSPSKKIVVGVFNPTEESILRLEHAFAKIKQDLDIDKKVIIANTVNVPFWQP